MIVLNAELKSEQHSNIGDFCVIGGVVGPICNIEGVQGGWDNTFYVFQHKLFVALHEDGSE